MEIKYKHNINENILTIIQEENIKQNYKIKMITQNNIQGLLPCSYNKINEKINVDYNITGMQSFENFYKEKKLGYNQIVLLYSNLVKCLESIDCYLLSSDNLMLKQNLVFVSPDEHKFMFCYNPNYYSEYNIQIKEFTSELMLITDHSDRKGTDLIYKLYDLCSNEQAFSNKIAEVLTVKTDIGTNTINYFDDNTEESIEEKKDIYSINTNNCKRNLESNIHKENPKENYIVYDNSADFEINENDFFDSYISKITTFIKEKLCIKEINKKRINNKRINNKNGSRNKYTKKDKDIKLNRKKIEMEDLDESLEKNIKENINKNINENINEETILISQSLNSYNRCLLSMLDNNNIKIDEYPFIVGKGAKNVNYAINDSTISRIHCKFLLENNCYYIQDLNSRNGTYINNDFLEPYQIVEINIGDKIRIGGMEYIFR